MSLGWTLGQFISKIVHRKHVHQDKDQAFQQEGQLKAQKYINLMQIWIQIRNPDLKDDHGVPPTR